MANTRFSPIEISKEEFRKAGYELIDTISGFIDSIRSKPVTSGESPEQIQEILGSEELPEQGKKPGEILSRAANLLMNHSLLNGHPRFLGYITSSAAPIGALADLLASAINPNAGAQILSPVATEIEKQTIKWLAELIGLPSNYGGILVSGGNMANFTGFLAGRTAKATKLLKEEGLSGPNSRLLVYCSRATHTWIEKAVVLFGHGTNSIRWIDTNANNQIDTSVLIETLKKDIEFGFKPVMIIGTAGDVSTGVVDDLRTISEICKSYDLWFHIDGAYGIPAAVIPGMKHVFDGIEEADSLALDPHKWLYNPLEAGCVLIKDANHLTATFSSHPVYYNFNTDGPSAVNYYEYGLQNSRGFRALKVWLCLQQVGREGYVRMISDDIKLSKLLYKLAGEHPELEAVTQNLSITTLRYVPVTTIQEPGYESYLNQLNESLLNELQHKGEVFLSNAVINGKYCLRGCIVNFRTSETDIHEIIHIIVREGRKMHARLAVADNYE